MEISRNALCLLLAGTLFHAQFYAASVSADSSTPRAGQTRMGQRTRPARTRPRLVSAAAREMLRRSFGRTDRVMRNDPTTAEALPNQGGMDSTPADESGRPPVQAGGDATASVITPPSASVRRVCTPNLSPRDRIAAIRRRAGVSDPNVSDAARAAADDPTAELLLAPEQREQLIQSVRSGRIRIPARALVRVEEMYMGHDSERVVLRFDPSSPAVTVTLPFSVGAALGILGSIDFVENELSQSVVGWLAEEGLAPIDNSAPEGLINRARRRDTQDAINAIARGVPATGVAAELVSNRRVLLVLKKLFARQVAARLVRQGVAADAVTAVRITRNAGRERVRIDYRKGGNAEHEVFQEASFLATHVSLRSVGESNRLRETLEDEIRYAVNEYLRNPNVALVSAEDITRD